MALKTLQKGLPAGRHRPDRGAPALRPTASRSTTAGPDGVRRTPRARPSGVGAGRAARLQPRATARPPSFSVVLDEDPTSDAALADVKGPIRDAAHAAAPDGHRGAGRRHDLGLRRLPEGDEPRLRGRLPGRRARDHADPGAAAAQPGRAALPDGLGRPRLRRHARRGACCVFQHVKGDAGLIFLLPIYIYLFVVALGTDYNILMIARLREEAREGREPRATPRPRRVKHAGPTVAAAGLILAGTFASLMLGGNALLVAMGFAISFGIFVAAFVMAMFFTPALTALIGHAAWWPGHGEAGATAAGRASARQAPPPAVGSGPGRRLVRPGRPTGLTNCPDPPQGSCPTARGGGARTLWGNSCVVGGKSEAGVSPAAHTRRFSCGRPSAASAGLTRRIPRHARAN